MSVLEAHRGRAAKLSQTLEALQDLHDQSMAVWDQIVEIGHAADTDRRERLDALHDEAHALADRIVRTRESSFGPITREARLQLDSMVESAQPSLVTMARLSREQR